MPQLFSPKMSINLNAIASNYNLISMLAGESADVACVLKADAYGCGALKVADALFNAGARTFFLTDLDEGIRLKAKYNESRIYLFYTNGEEQFRKSYEKGIVPVINRPEEIGFLTKIEGFSTQKIAFHIDTGINRLGFRSDELDSIQELLTTCEFLHTPLFISHFSNAEYADKDMCVSQINSLIRLRDKLCPAAHVSISNTGGIFLNSAYAADMVRTGVGILGYNHNPLGRVPPVNGLHPSVSVSAQVLDIKHLSPGQTVGYGSSFVSDTNMKIAILNIGYQHGFPKQLDYSDTVFSVKVRSHKAPVIGKVSMDMITLDVTDVPDMEIAVGDWVVVFDDRESVEQLAFSANAMIVDILIKMGASCTRSY